MQRTDKGWTTILTCGLALNGAYGGITAYAIRREIDLRGGRK
jgi:hypothetical protein